MKTSDIRFTFFGTSTFSVYVLDALREKGFSPTHIVTTPDKPQGRNLVDTPPPVKTWAIEHGIPYIQPETLRGGPDKTPAPELLKTLLDFKSDVFIVASYGNIIPQAILDIPTYQTLNVHPSLLPKLRGASPLQSAILHEDTTGVSIMRLDDKMDHGPVLAQETLEISPGALRYTELEKTLGVRGGHLLARVLPDWVAGRLPEIPQNHSEATYTEKFEKKDGEIDIHADPYTVLRKIRAFEVWPGTYFFTEKKGKQIRVIIKDAELNDDGGLDITRVIPEGKKEMDYLDFLKGL